MRLAIYARVSTADQNTDMQLVDLRGYAARHGHEIYAEYIDQGISGTKTSRPSLDLLMLHARQRQFDAVVVWKFDRFARSVLHLVTSLEEFRALGIQFISYTEALDTSTPMGAAMFSVIAAMAQLERDLIRERTTNGIAKARARGIRWGGRKRGDVNMVKARELITTEGSLRRAAKKLRISRTTLRRRLKETTA